MGKKGRIKRNCWHWNKEQIEEKDEKSDDEKNTAAVVFHEDVLMLSLEEQKCEHVAKNDVEWVVDSAASTMLSPQKGCSPHTKQATLVLQRWVTPVTQKLWELVMCASRPMLVAC